VARRANAFRQLSFDLRYGCPPDASIAEAVTAATGALLAQIEELSFTTDVIAGHDYYPASAPTDRSYATMARVFHARYGVPFMIAETSNLGLDPERGPAWLTSLYDQGCELRSSGIPFVGICWYSRGDQHDWHTTLTTPVHEVTEVGLFDMNRMPRPAAKAFRSLVGAPVPAVAGKSL